MAFADDFPELLVDKVEWRKVTGRNQFDEPSGWQARQVLPAMIEHTSRIIRDARGEEVVARGEAKVSGIPGIGTDDEITLRCPALPTLDGQMPVILDVRPQRDYDRAPYVTRIIF